MQKTILKIGRLHLWVSGSMVEPYSHIYYDYKDSYRGLDIFPDIWKTWESSSQDPITHKQKLTGVRYRFKLTNQTPKLIQWWLTEKSEYSSYCYYNQWDPEEHNENLPFIKFLFFRAKLKWQQNHCKHEWDVESHISPDSGSEDFSCKKCGVYHHICYY